VGAQIVGLRGKFDGKHLIGVTAREKIAEPQISKVGLMTQYRDTPIPLSIARETSLWNWSAKLRRRLG
jgi:hypothetical protein